MSALTAIGAAGSILSSAGGAWASALRNKEARKHLREDHEAEISEYSRLLNRNYADSPENLTLFRRVAQLARERYNRSRATNVVAGGTDAHLAAMQAQNGEVVSDTANGISSRSQANRDALMAAKRASDKAYAQQMFSLDQQQAQAIATAAGQATKAMAGIAAADSRAENPYGMFGLTQEEIERLRGLAQNEE